MSTQELEFVWGSTKVDETTKLELYKVLHEISSRFRKEDIEFILTQIDLLPSAKVVSEEIELVHELAKRSRGSGNSYSKLAVDFLWKIVIE